MAKRKREDNSTISTMELNLLNNNKKQVHDHQPNTMKSRPIIFILRNASLTKGFVHKRWKILDSDDDHDFVLKQNKNLDDFRPAIVYQALREILDSKLNKAGMVRAVYVKTDEGVLFEIKSHVRIPRTCKRFCGVMLELLKEKFIRTEDTNEVLMHVIEEPVTRHLPVNSRVVGLSYSAEKLVDIDKCVNSAGVDDQGLVFVVGAMAHGKINEEYADDFISVSNYRLESKTCIALICEALEYKWKSILG